VERGPGILANQQLASYIKIIKIIIKVGIVNPTHECAAKSADIRHLKSTFCCLCSEQLSHHSQAQPGIYRI